MVGRIPSPAVPVEAIDYLRARVAMSDLAAMALNAAAKRRAIWVAGLAQTALVNDVRAALESALSTGSTIEDFKASVGDMLESQWQGTVANPPARLETIFRTNTQTAYNDGRYAQATDPETKQVRPYWQFDAVLDSRTTDICKRSNGTVLPADHVWWKTHIGPLHHQCRSTFHPLTRRQAERLGLTAEPPHAPPADGFGSPPTD